MRGKGSKRGERTVEQRERRRGGKQKPRGGGKKGRNRVEQTQRVSSKARKHIGGIKGGS